MLDLNNLTTPKVVSLLRGAKIIAVLPLQNGLAMELELHGEQHVSVSFTTTMTPNGPGFVTNIQEI